MEYAEIRNLVSGLSSRMDLLNLLNKIKKDELGDKCFPFTVKQFNYFCNPNKCHSRYKTFKIPKKSGKLREISAPTKILKSMQTYANRIFQACYEPNEAAMGFIPGRSVVDNARKHVGRNYVLNIDLKDFFPSIPQARVWAVLKCPPFNFTEEVASALAGLCCMRIENSEYTSNKDRYRYVLPQGSPASPMLTNIVCQRLDRRLLGLAKRFNLKYSRYADDITFSSDHNVYSADGEFMAELHRIISDQNFTINENKTRLLKRGSRQEVTGLVVSSKVNVVRKYVRSVESLLYIWERYRYSDANARFLANYSGRTKGTPSMERVIEGKLMYLSMVKGASDSVYVKLRERFDSLLSTLNSRNGKGVDIRLSSKITDYEKKSGNRVDFRLKKDENGNVISAYAVIIPNDELKEQKIASLTKSCRTKVEEYLNNEDKEGLEKLKCTFFISLCCGKDGDFWRIQKCNPAIIEARIKKINEIGEDILLESIGEELNSSDPDTETKNDETGSPVADELLSTAEVIDELIASDGDLNILDRWDMTKKS